MGFFPCNVCMVDSESCVHFTNICRLPVYDKRRDIWRLLARYLIFAVTILLKSYSPPPIVYLHLHFELPGFGKIKNKGQAVVVCSFHQALGPTPSRVTTVGSCDGNSSFRQVTMEILAKSMRLKGRGWQGFRFTHKCKPVGLKTLNNFRSGKLI